MPFAPLFPDADYRHQFSVKRGDLARFFAPTAEHQDAIAERNHWLDDTPERFAAAIDSAGAAIDEAIALIGTNGSGSRTPDNSLGKIIALGRSQEPDIVLLEKQTDGIFRVVAGCVCFPSSWSFPEKLGLPLDSVHSVVPDLNAAIGAPISRFLDKMQPGSSWERSNWGLSASPERNQHPSRGIARLSAPLDLERVWLRVEDQILSILPNTKALLFGIRIVTCPLGKLRVEEPVAAAGLRRALETLPEPMARYKNISDVRLAIAEML